MKPAKALTILKAHNAWRRGSQNDMGDPTEIGQAIDTACQVLTKSLKPVARRSKAAHSPIRPIS